MYMNDRGDHIHCALGELIIKNDKEMLALIREVYGDNAANQIMFQGQRNIQDWWREAWIAKQKRRNKTK